MSFILTLLALYGALCLAYLVGRWRERAACRRIVLGFKSVIMRAESAPHVPQDEKDAMLHVVRLLDKITACIGAGSRAPSANSVGVQKHEGS